MKMAIPCNEPGDPKSQTRASRNSGPTSELQPLTKGPNHYLNRLRAFLRTLSGFAELYNEHVLSPAMTIFEASKPAKIS